MSSERANSERVAAGTMVFDGWDIAPAVVTHMVNQGIIDFYIVDHRSQGSPVTAFCRQIPKEARIHWVRKDSPYFSQSATTTALAHLARHDGFEAFVPFDVDEFFTGDKRTLVEEVVDWLDGDSTRALRIPVVNFYQSSDVTEFTTSSLAQVRYRAVDGEKPLEYLLESNPEFRRYPFSRPRFKSIMRLVNGTDGDFDWLTNGNHNVVLITSGERYPATVSSSITVLHLPFRSQSGIVSRRGNALRKQREGATSVDTGGREYSMEIAQRDREWHLASAPADSTATMIQIGGVTAVRDDRLAALAEPITTRLRSLSSPEATVIDETGRMSDISQDLAMAAIELSLQIRLSEGQPSKPAKGRSEAERSERNLERKILELQMQIDGMRPNLLKLIIERLRRR